MTETVLRKHMQRVLLKRFAKSKNGRAEALEAVLTVSAAHLDEPTRQQILEIVPQVPLPLQEKWIGLFIDRILETVPMQQLEDLCSGSEEADATLVLVHVMFLESEKMEKIIAADMAHSVLLPPSE